MQKMMSYLEGDSLLKEIEKSFAEDDDAQELEAALIDCTDSDGEGIVKVVSPKEPSTTKNKRPSSQMKSSSFTRPSSSITNYTASS